MSLKQYLILMSIGTAICWITWATILNSTNPADAGIIGFFLFYASLFLSIMGTFSVIGFAIRKKIINNDDIVFRHVKHTFRQSIIISALIIFALMLLAKDWLTWWNSIFLIALFIGLESIVFTQRKFSNIDYAK